MSPNDKRARRVVAIVIVTVFLDLAGFGIILPQLPLYVNTMGGTATTVGVLFSCFAFTQMIATPILGRMSDRRGRRRVMLVSLAGNVASMVLFAAAAHLNILWLLFFSRITAGATAGNISACQAAVADVTQGPARAKAMGLIGAGIGLGIVFGPSMGSLASRLGPSGPPLVAAALAFVDLLAAFFLMPETRFTQERPDATQATPADTSPYRAPSAPPKPTRLERNTWAILSAPRVATILLLYFLTFLYMTTLQVALALLARDRFGWQPKDIGTLFTFFGVPGLIIQGFLIGWLTRTFGARNLVVAGAFSSMVGLLTISGAFSVPVLLVGLAFFGTGLGVTNPLLSTLASEEAGPEQQGMVLGFAQSCGGLARTIGPTVTGILYAHLGPGAAFVGGASSAFVALIVAWITRSRQKAAAVVTAG